MTDEHPYTGADIERVTGGYVNSGVLRMWVSEGRVTAGPRAKSIRGGPRTFDGKTILKAALMAEFRKGGLSLLTAQQEAENFLETVRTLKGRSDKGWRQSLPMYFGIKPGTDSVIQIPANRAGKSLDGLMAEFGPTLLVVDVVTIVESVEKALGEEEAA